MARTEVILYLDRRYRFIFDYLFDDRKFLHYPRSREAGICRKSFISASLQTFACRGGYSMGLLHMGP